MNIYFGYEENRLNNYFYEDKDTSIKIGGNITDYSSGISSMDLIVIYNDIHTYRLRDIRGISTIEELSDVIKFALKRSTTGINYKDYIYTNYNRIWKEISEILGKERMNNWQLD